LETSTDGWRVEKSLLDYLESRWQEPDEGIWEVRGGPRHFMHSKMMAWVAMARAVQDAERFRLDGPVDRWRRLRDQIHAEICTRAYDADHGTFVQYYGGQTLDGAWPRPIIGIGRR
jgi:GH15 family glucan-1,4-alpha-glucosidase